MSCRPTASRHHIPAPFHPPSRIPSPPLPADATQVMLRYQDLMERFLETQRSLMSSYLQGYGAPDPEQLLPLAKIEETNGYHPDPIAELAKLSPPQAKPAPTPPEESEAPAAPAEAPAVRYDRNRLTDRLLGLVGQRTGYAKDMLGLDVDLEADLGIDSINASKSSPRSPPISGADVRSMATELEMEKLTVIRTLCGIIDYLDEALARPRFRSVRYRCSPLEPQPKRLRRGRLRSRARFCRFSAPWWPWSIAPSRHPCPILTEGVVLFTDDGRGIARSMADQLADLGQRTVFLRSPQHSASAPDPGDFHADLTDPEAVADMLRRVREEAGPVSGLFHLAPLAEAVEGEAWDHLAWRDVKALYLLARALGDDLRQSGRDDTSFLIAATGLGGGFGFEADAMAAAMPGHGGILGFVKCLAQEWPEVLVRRVDLNAEHPPAELAGPAPGTVLS